MNYPLPERGPLTPNQQADPEQYLKRITQTVDALGFDKSSMLVVGSSVLAAYGIRAPGDVDIVVGPHTWRDIAENRRSPSGLALTTYRERSHVLTLSRETPGVGGLGADIKTNYMIGDDMTMDEFEAAFRQQVNESPASQNGIHFASLTDVIRYHKEHPHFDRQKTQNDLGFIKRYLESYLAGEIIHQPAVPFNQEMAEQALSLLDRPKSNVFARWLRRQ